MKTQSLLGAIVGDILRTTFSDKNFVLASDKPILSEKSKISGYTVITLAVAKYIMEYYPLYEAEGRIEPGRSDKRKELLCKTILDLAKAHPELDYPEWLNEWLSNDKCIPTKDKDGMTGLCLTPLVIYFTDRAYMESIWSVLCESLSVITIDNKSVTGVKAVATAIYSNYVYNVQGTQDFMACLYNVRWPETLSDIDSKYGWNTSLLKAIEPALSVFYQGDDEFMKNRPVTELRSALEMVQQIDGLQTLVTPSVTTMMQANRGWWGFDELDGFRALMPTDLLEINDKFFEFMGERNYAYQPEDDDYSSSDIEPDENGFVSFGDLLKYTKNGTL